jgi:hypothetical protein
MKKRAVTGYFLSALLPVVAATVWMLRLFGSASRPASIVVYGLGVLSLVFAIRRHPRSHDVVSRGGKGAGAFFAENRGAVSAVFVFIACGWVLLVLVPPGRAEIELEPPSELATRLDRDVERVLTSAAAQERLVAATAELFHDPETAVNVDKRTALERAFASYLDHAVSLDRVVSTYQYFYRISPVRNLDLNVRSFLVGYAAFVAELEGASRLVDHVGPREVETVLNEARPEVGVPAGPYFRLKQALIGPDSALRFHAGRAHLEVLAAAGRFRKKRDLELVARTRAAYDEVSKRVVENPRLVVNNPGDFLESAIFPAWFPLQRGVSTAMGDIRTTDRRALVSPAQVRELSAKLEPGDVFVERRNWYLSNVGLPGFWPHAAIYVGTPEEQDRYFDAATRTATEGAAPSEYVARVNPKLADAFHGPGEHGPPRVIEAISEGVSLTSLEHSAGADYVAVLRPRLDRAAKLGALVRAYSMWGLPYDFDFDFVTDSSIVCSELVYKAYRVAEGRPGLRFELGKTADRLVLPPNDLIRKFDAEYGSPTADFDFIAFLDGSERNENASFRDAAALRESWRRPKWDVLQD